MQLGWSLKTKLNGRKFRISASGNRWKNKDGHNSMMLKEVNRFQLDISLNEEWYLQNHVVCTVWCRWKLIEHCLLSIPIWIKVHKQNHKKVERKIWINLWLSWMEKGPSKIQGKSALKLVFLEALREISSLRLKKTKNSFLTWLRPKGKERKWWSCALRLVVQAWWMDKWTVSAGLDNPWSANVACFVYPFLHLFFFLIFDIFY